MGWVFHGVSRTALWQDGDSKKISCSQQAAGSVEKVMTDHERLRGSSSPAPVETFRMKTIYFRTSRST
jgi:hypothetical protein